MSFTKKVKVKKNKKEVIQDPDFHEEATLLVMPLFYLHDFGFLEKTLHESNKILVEHALVLLGYSFEPRLNSRASGTEGSDMAIGLSRTECSHSKNSRKLQRLDAI